MNEVRRVLGDDAGAPRYVETLPGAATGSFEDLGSKNGTFVGAARIAGATPLADGDEIGVGSARMVFRASAAGSTETATG